MQNFTATTFIPDGLYLQDKVILITGAGDGIGRALALSTAQYGATVVLLGETTSKLESVYDEIEASGGPQAAIYPMDLSGATDHDYAKLVSTLRSQLGRLDGVVLNAGWIKDFRPFSQVTSELFQKTMTINLFSPFFMAQHCIPLLQETGKKGSIVISTHQSDRAYNGPFGCAKEGLKALVNILSQEFSGDKPVRVNAVDSGPVNTAMRRNNFPGEDRSQLPLAEDILAAYHYYLNPENTDTGEHVLVNKS